MINKLMKEKNITMYRLAKLSQLPYTTVSDICSLKTSPEKCSAETIYKIAKCLDVTMEELVAPYMEKRCDFDLFKSNVCHRVKELSDVDFVIDVLENDMIETYHKRKWYPESLYLLAMVDYLSRENKIPLCNKYDRLRQMKLEKPLFPSSILAYAAVSKDSEKVKEEAIRAAIPEFIRFNIVESEVRNVV